MSDQFGGSPTRPPREALDAEQRSWNAYDAECRARDAASPPPAAGTGTPPAEHVGCEENAEAIMLVREHLARAGVEAPFVDDAAHIAADRLAHLAAQVDDLQRRNTELVEQRRASEARYEGASRALTKALGELTEAREEAERQKRHNALVTATLRQERERRKSVQAAALAVEAEVRRLRDGARGLVEEWEEKSREAARRAERPETDFEMTGRYMVAANAHRNDADALRALLGEDGETR